MKNQADQSYMLDEYQIELENRIKNLTWTVSGNYALNTKPDIEAFKKSKYIALYDAIKQGAFDKYFDLESLALYLAKKVFMSADENMMMIIAQLCVDAAVYRKIIAERNGVETIRKKAFEDISELDFETLTSTLFGRVKLALIKEYLYHDELHGEKNVREIVAKINALSDAADTDLIIRTIDELYNEYVDKKFESQHGNLANILSVTLDELYNSDWADFLKDEIYEDAFETYINNVSAAVTNLGTEKPEEKQKTEAQKSVIYLDEEALQKMYTYVELNYGTSYLSQQESDKINRTLCKGMHADCTLFFTDGILHSTKIVNYQFKYAEKQLEKNKMAYYDNHRVVKRNIAILTDILKKALVLRNQVDHTSADHGVIVPSRLWKIGHSSTNKLFDRVIKNENLEFVVDILIDASGSQSPRQAKVAMQGYIISEALSNLGIPHRVVSFCSFWDYTVMRRFREYDDNREKNARLFEYTTSSNNRDGLAIKATVSGLTERKEENKILIVLSDGKPNDVNINRPKSRNPITYAGDSAIVDAALEVRKARAYGISVLGVFAGEEQDIVAEKKIFGKDFAYIRNISNFSNVVGLYLKKQIDLL